MKIVNIAHGALYLLASYVAWSLFQHYGYVVAIAGAAFAAACVDDEEMARGMGVNVPRVYAGVFVLSSFLAGLAGGIGAPFLGAYQGAQFDILLLALIVVVVGGLGSVAGAFVASMIIGILDSV